MDQANTFLSNELSSPMISEYLEQHQDDLELFEDGHYFELIGTMPREIEDVQCICSKMYTSNGLCFITIYFEAVFYCIIADLEEDEPLLDIVFPDVSGEGDGITLGIYDGNEQSNDYSTLQWRKLSLWQSIPVLDEASCDSSSIPQTVALPSDVYMQTYCILKPNKLNRSDRDVLFRFGSWCYSGNVELIETLAIDDIPHVIPALRVQQHELTYLCDISSIPEENIFSEPMIYNNRITTALEEEILSVESVISAITEKSNTNNWFGQDPRNIFFEFSSVNTNSSIFTKNHIDLIATKSYRPNGLIVMTIYFDGTYYVCINDGDGDQPLLDSKFPCIVQGKGYQLKTYPNGLESFPELRNFKVWQNAQSINNNSRQESSMKGDGEAKNKNEENYPKKYSQQDFSGQLNGGSETKSKNEGNQHKNLKQEYKEKHRTMSKNKNDDSITQHQSHSQTKDIKSTKSLDYKSEETKIERTYTAEEKKVDQLKSKNEYKDSKSISFNISSNINSRKRQNFGAFHHLAPLRKPSALAEQMKIINIKHSGNKKSPYDETGKPLS